MAEGRSQNLWQHTSSVLALLANLHRDPKKSSVFKPSDFNPYTKPETTSEAQVPQVKISSLKDLFIRDGAKVKVIPSDQSDGR